MFLTLLKKQAQKTGQLKPGMTIIESTSGNTGIGVTLVGVLLPKWFV